MLRVTRQECLQKARLRPMQTRRRPQYGTAAPVEAASSNAPVGPLESRQKSASPNGGGEGLISSACGETCGEFGSEFRKRQRYRSAKIDSFRASGGFPGSHAGFRTGKCGYRCRRGYFGRGAFHQRDLRASVAARARGGILEGVQVRTSNAGRPARSRARYDHNSFPLRTLKSLSAGATRQRFADKIVRLQVDTQTVLPAPPRSVSAPIQPAGPAEPTCPIAAYQRLELILHLIA